MTSTSPDSWWSSQYCRPAARYSVCSSGFSFSMASQQVERCSADSRFSEYFNFAWLLSKLYPSGLGTHASKIMTTRQKHLEQQQGLRRDRHGRAWPGMENQGWGRHVTFTIRQENVVFPCWMSLQILGSCESTFLRCFETGKDFLPHCASCPLNESNENELKCGQSRTLCIQEKYLKHVCSIGRIAEIQNEQVWPCRSIVPALWAFEDGTGSSK